MKKVLFCFALAPAIYIASCSKTSVPVVDDPEEEVPPPPTYTHGSLKSIVVAGSGTKEDNNTANYTFAGHRHMHHRFTDFDSATTEVPATNTKAGWLAHTGGIYPIITSDDFNSQAAESGVTISMTGGPTPSGKFAKRHNNDDIKALFPKNSRLRNFNLFQNVGVKSHLHVGFYLRVFRAQSTGKFARFFWRRGDLDPSDVRINHDFWIAKKAGTQFNWRTEWVKDGYLPGWADQKFEVDDKWIRFEMLFDFTNDSYQILVDGNPLTDESNGYNGIMTGHLGSNCTLRYGLLGNTIEEMLPDQFVGWAQPFVDFDTKRIELADNATWSARTKSVIQPIKSWTSDNIQFIVNQGDFADLTNKHIFYVDGTTVTYIGAL
jgi:hypothetical protein